jgi:internalin A
MASVGRHRDGERTIRFPSDCSLGQLWRWVDEHGERKAYTCAARGVVSVEAEARVELVIDLGAAADLSPLSMLQPDDLQGLSLFFTHVPDSAAIHLRGLTGLQKLDLIGTDLSDHGLDFLGQFGALEDLRLPVNVSNHGLRHIQDLTRLRVLDLSTAAPADDEVKALLAGHVVDDEGLRYLANLHALEELSLANLPITDKGLWHLRGLTALHSLVLLGTNVIGSGLAHLQDCQALRDLNLSDTPMRSASVVHLVTLKALEELDLQFNNVDDSAMAAISALSGLRVLNLEYTAISNAGLESLHGLHCLQEVYLTGTLIDQAGRDALQRALPTCEVS